MTTNDVMNNKKGQDKTTIRLTIRGAEMLIKQIYGEAARRGTNVNQTMIYILTQYFKNHQEE